LEQYLVASTSVLDEAAEIISHTYCDHEIRILDPISSLKFQLSEAPLSRITIGAMSFDTEIHYDLGETETYYLIQLADTGAIEYVNGGEVCDVTPGRGMVTSPTRPLRIHYTDRSRGFIVKILKSALERQLLALTGIPVTEPLIFSAGVAADSAFGARYKRLLHYMVSELDGEGSLRDSPLLVANIEDIVMTALLADQPHNYSRRFEDQPASAAERHVEDAEAYIRAHATEALTIEDLVALTGVSGRSLYRAFQIQRGYSPMAFVRSIRVQIARECLMNARPGTTVTGIAMECGLDHLGRFSRDYGQRFAESPSETLKRALRKHIC
jgi:AraC-like DNA-binding protein